MISIMHCTVIAAKLENEDEWLCIADSFIRDCKSEGIPLHKFQDERSTQQRKISCCNQFSLVLYDFNIDV